MLKSKIQRILALSSAAAIATGGLVLGTATAASAATIAVPGDYATIQLAVNAATPGDTINVAAGSYTENVNIPAAKNLTLTGAGSATTTVTGRLTLGAATTVSGFTLQGQSAAPYAQDPIWITSTGAGSIVENNVIQNGLRGVYIDHAVGTSASHTIVRNNTISEAGFGNTGAVWIASSDYVDVLNNVFANTTAGGVGVNLVGGSSNVLIDHNSFDNFGNVMVLIANSSGFPSTPQGHDVTFSNNTITNSTGTPLYIGGNNLKDVSILNNSITDTAGASTAAIFITPGYSPSYDQWLESSNRPLEGFVIEGNLVDNAAYGVNVRSGSQLATSDAVQIIENRFCTVNVAAINNTNTTSLLAIDNDFCGSTTIGPVEIRNTPVLANTGTQDALPLGLGAFAVLLLGSALVFWRKRTSTPRP